MSTEVGQTILQQLGGRRFTMMTGAKSYAAGNFPKGPGLSMKLPGGKGVIITLNGRDLYDLEVIRSGYFRKGVWVDTKTVGEESDVYVEDLRETFTRLTGLHTSL